MERLYAKYRERIEAQKIDIRFKAHMRSAMEEKSRARAMERMRANKEHLERAAAARIKVESQSKA